MVIFVEYAFLQNFFFDAALLCLALVASKTPLQRRRIIFAAACGGGFALVYPLLTLPIWGGLVLKIAVGLLLCLLACGRVKTKKERGRYALSSFLFFFLTFAFGGALSALQTALSLAELPLLAVGGGFCLLCVGTSVLIAKIYQKRRVHAFIYPCEARANGKTKRTYGYLDSGNAASKNGLLVCFVSADVFYELFGEEILFSRGRVRDETEKRVCDEIELVTMTGVKKAVLRQGELVTMTEKGKRTTREVYFALGANMINREYEILLNARIFEDIE